VEDRVGTAKAAEVAGKMTAAQQVAAHGNEWV
jgi:hypothetical protein